MPGVTLITKVSPNHETRIMTTLQFETLSTILGLATVSNASTHASIIACLLPYFFFFALLFSARDFFAITSINLLSTPQSTTSSSPTCHVCATRVVQSYCVKHRCSKFAKARFTHGFLPQPRDGNFSLYCSRFRFPFADRRVRSKLALKHVGKRVWIDPIVFEASHQRQFVVFAALSLDV